MLTRCGHGNTGTCWECDAMRRSIAQAETLEDQLRAPVSFGEMRLRATAAAGSRWPVWVRESIDTLSRGGK